MVMTSPEAFLDIRGAAKAFGGTMVLDGVDLAVARGEFISLLGPSGCGKTTLLRIVAGLLAADTGTTVLDGDDISRKPPHHRDVGVVFQSYALFPHLTVAENVAFGLQARGAPKDEIAATVSRYLGLAHMTAFADRSVRALSGGQQQRVAVARALAVKPKLMLLDEPFSALDRKLRETMQIELKRLLREVGTTAIFVTHDQDEALTMSDRIAVMNRGRIEQLGDALRAGIRGLVDAHRRHGHLGDGRRRGCHRHRLWQHPRSGAVRGRQPRPHRGAAGADGAG
jgi:putative spermidine/putrescine transport system ATP-binding protein